MTIKQDQFAIVIGYQTYYAAKPINFISMIVFTNDEALSVRKPCLVLITCGFKIFCF